MRRPTCLLALALVVIPVQGADEWTIALDEWLRPRSGERVLHMDGVAEAVRAWQANAGSALVIRYPGGEEGVLWAEELRSWIVGLGVPSTAVRLAPGTDQRDRIVVALSARNRQ